MSNYTITTNFGAKDSLPSGNAGKVIKGSEFTTEFTNIQTAVATKADTAGDTFTGAVTFDAAVTLNADVTFDTNTLFIDVSANKVGIGNTSPAYELDVTGSAQLSGGDLILRGDSTDADTQSIRFENASGDDRSAYIRADYSTNSSGNATSLVFGTNPSTGDGSDRMVIDNTGKVGIGTSSPQDKLHVSTGTDTDSGNIAFTIGGTSTSNARTASITKNTSTPYELTIQAGNHATSNTETVFKSSDSKETMRIDSSGNVLVGKTTSGSTIQGAELHNSGSIFSVRDSNPSGTFDRKTTNGDVVQFRRDGTTVGSVSATSSATSYNTSSDERLKENITDSADAGSKVDAIQIRQFDWKADGSHQDYGVIAQELVTVAPEAVSEGDTEEDMMGVDYSKLVPMLIKEVQSLRSRVAELESE